MSAQPIPFDGGKPHIAVVMLDPTTAERWLTRNIKNRGLKRYKIEQYAEQMRAGQWKLTGEAIKFAPDGTMLDGQNRCHAVIKSGVTIPIVVARNIPADAQDVMDTGAARTPGDMLTLHGIPKANTVAAAAKLAYLFDAGKLTDGDKAQVPHPDIRDYVASNYELLARVATEAAVRRAVDMPPRVTCCAMFLTARVDPEAAAEFWARAADGVGLPAGSPILALMNRLRELRKDRVKVTSAGYLSLSIRAWNAWRDGRTVHRIPLYSTRDGAVIPCPQPK